MPTFRLGLIVMVRVAPVVTGIAGANSSVLGALPR